MKLRVVEIKGNDLYVLYDVDGGGVCCCSKYTINQLMKDYGVKIEGVTVTPKGIVVQELGLDGKVRTKKAPIICEDETKRSAVTIIKGLDEKRYPRVKQERGGQVVGSADIEVEKGEKVEVGLADGTTMTLRVGEIKKFEGIESTSTGIIKTITENKWDINSKATKNYVIGIITTMGTEIEMQTKKISEITSCRLENGMRELLIEALGYRQREDKMISKEKGIEQEMEEEVKRVRQKYYERVEAERKKRGANNVKYKQVIEKMLRLQDKVNVRQEIVGDLKKKLGDKLRYTVIKDNSYAGVEGKTGELEISARYNPNKKQWVVYMQAVVNQRVGYRHMEKLPFFEKEYDGTLIAIDREMMLRGDSKIRESWLQEEAYYISTINNNLEGGEKSVRLGVNDASKGSFNYYYTIKYEISSSYYPTRAEYNEMLKQIK